MNNTLSPKNCNSNQAVGQVDVKDIMDTFELEDVWRRRNPDKLLYTWEVRGKSSRIDHWIISKSTYGQTDKVIHTKPPFSDHSAIQINICIDETERGSGLWKMNTSIITNPIFKSNFDRALEELKQEQKLYPDIKTWWDVTKRIKNTATHVSNKTKTDQSERERE